MDAGQKAVEEGGEYKMIKLEKIKEEKKKNKVEGVYVVTDAGLYIAVKLEKK